MPKGRGEAPFNSSFEWWTKAYRVPPFSKERLGVVEARSLESPSLRRLLHPLLIVVLLLSACSPARVQAPAPTATTTTTAAAPTPVQTPRAPPLPTVTPGPSVPPLPDSVLAAGGEPGKAFAGAELTYNVGGLKPLEEADITLAGPGGYSEAVGTMRADRKGFFTFPRDSSKDALGDWTLSVTGELGSRVTLRYRLDDFPLPTLPAVEGETQFRVFQTSQANFYFQPTVRPAAVRRVASVAAGTLAQIPPMLGATGQPNGAADDRLDFYLLADAEALKREVAAAGAHQGAGMEAGVSLYGFKRSGVYIDMSNPWRSLPHIVAHEITHQINARLQPHHDIPHWLEEGLAEYAGHHMARQYDVEQEQHWRRQFRETARKALREGKWVDLREIARAQVWYTEADVNKGLQYYAQAYVALDFVAKRYGEQALRPLFDHLALSDTDADAAFKAVLGLSAAEFERAVIDSLSQMDLYEKEAQAVMLGAQLVLRVRESELALHKDWDRYREDRLKFTRAERARKVSGFAMEYSLLAASVESARLPTALAEPRDIFRSAFSVLQVAMENVATYEAGGNTAYLTDAEAGLNNADFLLAAAHDRLLFIMAMFAVPADNILPAQPPTPSPSP